MEDKIDGIVSLLAAGQNVAQSTPTLTDLSLTEETVPSMRTPDSLVNDSSSHSSGRITRSSTDDTSSSFRQVNLPQHPAIRASIPPEPVFGLTWEQANMALDEFRINYKPNFPFVTIALDMSAETLFTKKPFLFRVIMFVAATLPPSRKKDMKRNVMAYLGQHLLVMEERHMDLLEGLLVFIAWYYLISTPLV